jgi:UDP-glucose 4-epimerase
MSRGSPDPLAGRRIAVTGGTGFIGSHLVRRLADRGCEVHLLVRPGRGSAVAGQGVRAHECSLADAEDVRSVLTRVAPEFVLHLASRARPGRELTELGAQFENTIQPALSVAAGLPESVRLAIFFGSCEEYGNGPAPFQEDQALVAFSSYGWGKIAAFHGVRMTCLERGLRWTWVRPFLTYGSGRAGGMLLPSLIEGCLADREIPLTGGEQTRDFIHVQDVCLMVERILEDPVRANGLALNLCSGEPRRIRDVAEIVRAAAGRGRLCFGALPYRSREAMQFYGSTDRYRGLFGEVELRPFELELQATVSGWAGRR